MIEKEIDIEIFAEQNVVLCLWDFWIDAPVEPHKDDVAYSLYNLTKFNLLNQHDIIDGGNYIEDKDIDVCIAKAHATKRKYAIISALGHYMHYSVVWKLIQYAENNPQAGLIAHLIDDRAPSRRTNGWFGIHPQLFLINLHTWAKIRKPKFGLARELTKDVLVPKIQRSKINVHDDYTPLWYKPNRAGKVLMKLKGTQFYWGSNLINELLLHEYECHNIPDKARDDKKFFYADMITTEEELENINHSTNDVLSNYFQGFTSAPFLFNTEYYKEHECDHISNSFKNFIILPSGFKGHWLIEQLGYTGKERIFFYDINISSIRLRRLMIDTWDGRDFVTWLNDNILNSNICTLLNIDKDTDFDFLWENEIRKWNGLDNFRRHWDKILTSKDKISYFYWDIVKDMYKTEEVNQLLEGNSFMWVSNIWHTGQLLNQYNLDNLTTEFNKFKNTINSNIVLHGIDPEGMNILPLKDDTYGQD